MKKSIALILALVLALGMLTACGTTEAPAAAETPAAATEAPAVAAEAPAATAEAPATTTTEAPAATEAPSTAPAAIAPATDALREGSSVTVSTKAEFQEAWAQLYAEGSTVNEIKLTADIDVSAGDYERPEGSKIPNWSVCPKYLIVRMPDGTQLDLNGFKLICRALNGYDDETGKYSNKITMGKVVDSFGGGKITLVAWNSAGMYNKAVRLARENPEFVKQITITQPLKKAEDSDLVVPANVRLFLANKDTEITCNSITFETGATYKQKYEEAPGIKGSKRVVFECTSEADKTREGIEFATVVVDK